MPDISSEAIFVLIFLLISFISWISEKLKGARRQGRVVAPPQQQRPEQRYEAEPPDFPTAPRRQQQSPQPNDAMRDILRSLGIPVEEEEPVSAPPPPLPREPTRFVEPAAKRVIPKAVDPELLLSRKERAALKRKKGNYGISEHHSGHPARAARRLLKPQNVQAAFILKEILDKPKCFEI